ncbi:MAG: hydroxyphenylacetyl-CoA thioesterase PaaI [Desulfosudaceae bacterium]
MKTATPIDNDRFAQWIGIDLAEVATGYARAEMTVAADHLNGLGLAHGGAIFTLADLAFAAAANSHGVDAVAVNVNMSYFKACRPGDHLTAAAEEISLSRKLGTYQITVTNQDGQRVALMQGTTYRKTQS